MCMNYSISCTLWIIMCMISWTRTEGRNKELFFNNFKVNLLQHHTRTLTFYSDLSGCFYHAQRWHGHARIVRWLPYVGHFQHISTQRHFFVLGQLYRAHHPLHIWHWWAHRHTGQVDASAWHHLLIGGWDGESRWDSPHYEVTKRRSKAK